MPRIKIFRMIFDPRMIGRDVVGHEVQDEVYATFRELLPGNGKAFWPSKMLVDHIAPHTIGRANVVFRTEVGKCAPKIIQQVLF